MLLSFQSNILKEKFNLYILNFRYALPCYWWKAQFSVFIFYLNYQASFQKCLMSSKIYNYENPKEIMLLEHFNFPIINDFNFSVPLIFSLNNKVMCSIVLLPRWHASSCIVLPGVLLLKIQSSKIAKNSFLVFKPSLLMWRFLTLQ